MYISVSEKCSISISHGIALRNDARRARYRTIKTLDSNAAPNFRRDGRHANAKD